MIELKEYDNVELIVDREYYKNHGIFKGMQGWICYYKKVPGYSLVEFPLYGEEGIIDVVQVRDEDLKLIDDWNAHINKRIMVEHQAKAEKNNG